MNDFDRALSAFGAGIGLPDLAVGAGGNAALQMESGRRIAIEAAGSDVLVYVSDPAPYDAPERLLKAWKRAHYSRLDGTAVQAALRVQDGVPRLLAVTRLSGSDASEHTIKQAVDTLARWLDAARED